VGYAVLHLLFYYFPHLFLNYYYYNLNQQQPSGIAGPRAGRSSAAWGLDRADEDFTERLFPLLAASRSPAELKAAIQLVGASNGVMFGFHRWHIFCML
jgi:hypothetical protein